MGYIDHIRACNNHDLSRFVSFQGPAGQFIGWVRRDNLALLSEFHDVFDFTQDVLRLKKVDDITAHMAQVTQALQDKKQINGWRGELYAVSPRFGEEPLFLIERAATPLFGIRAYGVHINGFVRDKGQIKMWIAKRAADRMVCPDMWDNMVAGGQPAGLSLMGNIIKECGEEAGIPEDLARQAQSVGTVSYMMETDGGLKPDVMFCYDLEVPKEFVPNNTDGEVASFHLMDVEEVADIVKNTFDFKFNCNLVIIDFLIRHGVLNPDEVREYEELVRGLRR
ncbi:DUF4743 domain-containing protein [Terasakiella sp.]|uniref:DUF4743 domain-containing protein n=1 Tax=Terasakiella sp. TaxID=2034861 RepID=UPI003AA984DF